MFGIQLIEIVYFIKQAGLAVTGAACLWGMVWLVRANRAKSAQERQSFEWAAHNLLIPFSGGLALALLSWLASIFLFPFKLLAHEGIVIVPTTEQVLAGFQATSPLYIMLLVLAIAAVIFYVLARQKFMRYLHMVFASFFFPIFIFSVISIVISLPALAESWGNEQMFFIGHGFHSIFTLGTVLILDFTMLSIKDSPQIQRHLYPFLPTISKVIWVGLAVDFVSVWLVFDQAFVLTPKFFFMQTVVAILIVNGAFLSGPITRHMISLVKKDGVRPLVGKWKKWSGLAGVISISSWITITMFDYFTNITLSYPQLLLVYVGILLVAFVGYQISERLTFPPPKSLPK